MNTHKFTGDMSSQVEADRDQLVEMKEVLSWASDNVGSLCKFMEQWHVAEGVKQVSAPTLYAALHAAWSNRGKT